MVTRYNTGQAILIPATIRNAREENGVIVYEVDSNLWDGIPEDAIIVDEGLSAKIAYDNAMRELSRNMTERY